MVIIVKLALQSSFMRKRAAVSKDKLPARLFAPRLFTHRFFSSADKQKAKTMKMILSVGRQPFFICGSKQLLPFLLLPSKVFVCCPSISSSIPLLSRQHFLSHFSPSRLSPGKKINHLSSCVRASVRRAPCVCVCVAGGKPTEVLSS